MLEGSNMTDGERLWFAMNEAGLIAYGALIEESFVHEVLGIRMPEVGTQKVFQRFELIELSAIDYVRDKLLSKGMCMPKSNGYYRIPLPSENAAIVSNWIDGAARKLRRADRLRRNTDPEKAKEGDQTAARILMQEEAIKASRDHARSVG